MLAEEPEEDLTLYPLICSYELGYDPYSSSEFSSARWLYSEASKMRVKTPVMRRGQDLFSFILEYIIKSKISRFKLERNFVHSKALIFCRNILHQASFESYLFFLVLNFDIKFVIPRINL